MSGHSSTDCIMGDTIPFIQGLALSIHWYVLGIVLSWFDSFQCSHRAHCYYCPLIPYEFMRVAVISILSSLNRFTLCALFSNIYCFPCDLIWSSSPRAGMPSPWQTISSWDYFLFSCICVCPSFILNCDRGPLPTLRGSLLASPTNPDVYDSYHFSYFVMSCGLWPIATHRYHRHTAPEACKCHG